MFYKIIAFNIKYQAQKTIYIHIYDDVNRGNFKIINRK